MNMSMTEFLTPLEFVTDEDCLACEEWMNEWTIEWINERTDKWIFHMFCIWKNSLDSYNLHIMQYLKIKFKV